MNEDDPSVSARLIVSLDAVLFEVGRMDNLLSGAETDKLEWSDSTR